MRAERLTIVLVIFMITEDHSLPESITSLKQKYIHFQEYPKTFRRLDLESNDAYQQGNFQPHTFLIIIQNLQLASAYILQYDQPMAEISDGHLRLNKREWLKCQVHT